MVWISVAMVLVLSSRKNETNHVLTQTGQKLTRVELDPEIVKANWWQYRMYAPDVPSYGEPFWGLIEEKSFK